MPDNAPAPNRRRQSALLGLGAFEYCVCAKPLASAAGEVQRWPMRTRLSSRLSCPQVVDTILRHLAVWHDPPPRPPPHGLPRLSSAGRDGVSGAVPAIGNEPGRGTLPVVSAILARAPDIALSFAFLA